MSGPIVVKLGGSRGGQLEDLTGLLNQVTPGRVVVIHGGGPEISSMLDRLGIQAHFEEGLRVTDAEAMDVVEMVLAGRVNKQLAGRLQALGFPAVGLSGPDGATVQAQPYREGRLGKVGEVTRVDPRLLQTLLAEGFLPLMAPIGLARDGSSLNINGDTVAAEVAIALQAERLIFLTDVPGLLDAEGQCLERVSAVKVQAMLRDGTISGGMIPKLEGGLKALERGVEQVEVRRSFDELGTVLEKE